MDKFKAYLESGSGKWHKRALTDCSMMRVYGLREEETNLTLATYGDAVLKFALCELLLDHVEELTIEKAKYESDVSLVRIAEHYQLLDYLEFDKNDGRIPRDYRYWKIEHHFSVSKKEKAHKFNRRRKYIATAIEAVLGAMYQDHRDFGEIKEVVRAWMDLLESFPDFVTEEEMRTEGH